MLPGDALYRATDRSEAETVEQHLTCMDETQRAAALAAGRALLRGVRSRAHERPFLDAFLQEFGLSNEEGIALMCLAEALLRIPDDANADLLIAEKFAAGNWSAHAGGSDSLFVNASTWGLMLTGQLVELPPALRSDQSSWLRRLAQRMGEPLLRKAMRGAMRLIGDEFVAGRDIGAALERSRRERSLGLCSFDMLGEGARTDLDARRYFAAYEHAISAIGAANREQHEAGGDPHTHSSISIKLSALEPRYALAQRARVHQRLVPRALQLAQLAAAQGVALTVDAEEADRLEVSLQVIEAMAGDAATRDWPGLGLAVQAYGRRASAVIDWVRELARVRGRRMAVRLVKGAYWDTEIKRTQERGLAAYPVYTRKLSTDVAYLAGARQLLAASDWLYPQFATHNAHTIAAVMALRAPGARLEFQRLHGMGSLIYDEARRTIADFPAVRIYAPVGAHEDLLAYLVRRLLENGANSSFVNRFMDERVPVEDVISDPIAEAARLAAIPHPGIPLPAALYGDARVNSRGADFGEERTVVALEQCVAAARTRAAAPAERAAARADVGLQRVTNPADRRDDVGRIAFAQAADVAAAFAAAATAGRDWNDLTADARAACLEAAAAALEAQRDHFVPLLVREAGKTLPDALAEVREAADFCRYYAAEARRLFADPTELRGPTGESNRLRLGGRGVFACISPWNFPLAIYTGQIAAALAAGNTVVAKPAEHTPLVAAAMTALLHDAGVPAAALHCLPMAGREFGATALLQPALAGVVFTGSTATAQWLNRALAARDGAILPLIAETGGLNAMVVDSTALPEQVVDAVIESAFGSAGQRCSALRLLCVQEEIAERLLAMLCGAMDELVIGDPAHVSTDVGPVIAEAAAAQLLQHVQAMRREARVLHACTLGSAHAHGSFVAPHLIELRAPAQLQREHFGPLLHVVRYRASELEQLLAAITASGYALTLGVQTRLESTWQRVYAGTRAGNVYVNRNMTGAVVGVQPFGGSGLSGTGPKAGGPHYLTRLATERTLTINTTATGGNTALLRLD
jgi:RHH-type transcriptional regulator, proline utilization regulon repressor / proline dehydrogenase / delta 1-pyrroline-5-carboxylate dehydrogenase